jgi:hypothetical protein
MVYLKLANRVHSFLITKIREPRISNKDKQQELIKIVTTINNEQLLCHFNWRWPIMGVFTPLRTACRGY